MTAMSSTADETFAAATAMPRFEDGPINLQELLRQLAEAVMCDMDDAWAGSRYFSVRMMSELYDEGRVGDPPTAEQAAGFGLVAQRAIGASPELADELEAA